MMLMETSTAFEALPKGTLMPPSVVNILNSRDGAVDDWAHCVPYQAKELALPIFSSELSSSSYQNLYIILQIRWPQMKTYNKR